MYACSKALRPDKLRGFSPPEGVGMQLLLAVKDWIEAADDKEAQGGRWKSMAAKARKGWCSNWNAMGDAKRKSRPIPLYTERYRSGASTSKIGTITPDAETEVWIVDTIVRERERRPYGPPASQRTDWTLAMTHLRIFPNFPSCIAIRTVPAPPASIQRRSTCSILPQCE